MCLWQFSSWNTYISYTSWRKRLFLTVDTMKFSRSAVNFSWKIRHSFISPFSSHQTHSWFLPISRPRSIHKTVPNVRHRYLLKIESLNICVLLYIAITFEMFNIGSFFILSWHFYNRVVIYMFVMFWWQFCTGWPFFLVFDRYKWVY